MSSKQVETGKYIIRVTLDQGNYTAVLKTDTQQSVCSAHPDSFDALALRFFQWHSSSMNDYVARKENNPPYYGELYSAGDPVYLRTWEMNFDCQFTSRQKKVLEGIVQMHNTIVQILSQEDNSRVTSS